MMKSLFEWIVNVGLKILVLKKRENNIWLFGAWNGDTYNDNSKYLFEYITRKFPTIDAIWITKNESIKNDLQSRQQKCYLYNEKTAQKLRLTAKYVFFTNGINDIGQYDLSHGSIKIALWHGMPLKKLLYATNNIQKKDKSLIRLLQYWYLKIYNQGERNFTIATSKTTKDFLIRSFEVEPDTVLITGQPRNDILFNDTVPKKIRSELKHNSNEKFILYMPTWRQFGQNDNFLDTLIEHLTKDTFLMDTLVSDNIKLYVKPHPRISIKVKSQQNIIIFDKKSNIDSQELMAAADVLITDYSSVFIDYALLDKAIHFYVPDLEDYKENGNDLFLAFDEFSDFIIEDIDTFKNVLLKSTLYYEQGLNNCKKTNIIFDDVNLRRGKYCETVINTLLAKKIINIKEKS